MYDQLTSKDYHEYCFVRASTIINSKEKQRWQFNNHIKYLEKEFFPYELKKINERIQPLHMCAIGTFTLHY